MLETYPPRGVFLLYALRGVFLFTPVKSIVLCTSGDVIDVVFRFLFLSALPVIFGIFSFLFLKVDFELDFFILLYTFDTGNGLYFISSILSRNVCYYVSVIEFKVESISFGAWYIHVLSNPGLLSFRMKRVDLFTWLIIVLVLELSLKKSSKPL